MTTLNNDPAATLSAVLHMAGLGIQATVGELDQVRAELQKRDERARANLAQLDQIMLETVASLTLGMLTATSQAAAAHAGLATAAATALQKVGAEDKWLDVAG